MAPGVVVHLVDGTFELFRYFLSPAAAFDRSAPPEPSAVPVLEQVHHLEHEEGLDLCGRHHEVADAEHLAQPAAEAEAAVGAAHREVPRPEPAIRRCQLIADRRSGGTQLPAIRRVCPTQ